MSNTKQHTMTPENNPTILRGRLKLVTAQRDVAREYLTTAQQNLSERNAEVDQLKEELRELKKSLSALAK